MTFLEVVGASALITIAGHLVGRMIKRGSTPTVEEFGRKIETQLRASVREAFEAGMLTAADMVTLEGYSETAGKIRKVVEYSRADNDI